jgi:UMP-CMP kinase
MWESQARVPCDFVLELTAPECLLEQRLLGRQDGRVDDNVDTIRKRFEVR